MECLQLFFIKLNVFYTLIIFYPILVLLMDKDINPSNLLFSGSPGETFLFIQV